MAWQCCAGVLTGNCPIALRTEPVCKVTGQFHTPHPLAMLGRCGRVKLLHSSAMGARLHSYRYDAISHVLEMLGRCARVKLLHSSANGTRLQSYGQVSHVLAMLGMCACVKLLHNSANGTRLQSYGPVSHVLAMLGKCGLKAARFRAHSPALRTLAVVLDSWTAWDTQLCP